MDTLSSKRIELNNETTLLAWFDFGIADHT